MPNCDQPGCKAYVVAEGLLCRVHQDEDTGPDVMVTYNGPGFVQLAQGNFVKGTTASVPARVAAELKKDSNWTVLD